MVDRAAKEKILAAAKAELLKHTWDTFVDEPLAWCKICVRAVTICATRYSSVLHAVEARGKLTGWYTPRAGERPDE